MVVKLLRWFIFSVTLALVPLIVSWVIQKTHGQTPSLSSLLSHGELLLITAALCATAAGELIGSGAEKIVYKLVSGGFSLLILIFSAIYFSDVSATLLAKQNIDLEVVKNTSMIVFFCAIVSSGSCVALAEVKE